MLMKWQFLQPYKLSLTAVHSVHEKQLTFKLFLKPKYKNKIAGTSSSEHNFDQLSRHIQRCKIRRAGEIVFLTHCITHIQQVVAKIDIVLNLNPRNRIYCSCFSATFSHRAVHSFVCLRGGGNYKF